MSEDSASVASAAIASPAVRVVVLGAGFGGLELSTLVHEACGDEAAIILIDKAPGFVFGFSKLDVMFGRKTPDAVRHAYRQIAKPGVRLVQTEVRAFDPKTRRVETTAGEIGRAHV